MALTTLITKTAVAVRQVAGHGETVHSRPLRVAWVFGARIGLEQFGNGSTIPVQFHPVPGTGIIICARGGMCHADPRLDSR